MTGLRWSGFNLLRGLEDRPPGSPRVGMPEEGTAGEGPLPSRE